MNSLWRGVMVLAVSAVCIGGCAKVKIPEPAPAAAPKDYYRQCEGPALRKITDPARIPDFRPAFGNTDGLIAAIDQSIRYMGTPSSRKKYPVQGDITHERVLGALTQFKEFVNTASSPDELQSRIVGAFDVYESVGCDDQGTVLFTGYYTPIFQASLTPTAEFKYPLYKRPANLVVDSEGNTQGLREGEGSIVPCPTRAQIEAGAFKGAELVYLKDRFEAYICTVQGSARLHLTDGSWFNVGYHGNNGKEYTAIGMLMVKDGKITRDQLTLSGLMAYFKDNPQQLETYLPRNERYVFFQKSDTAPMGSLGVPVTAYRSLATDKTLFPRAALTFVQTKVPQNQGGNMVQQPFSQFMCDQDTGGAIRAAGRADIYLGVGDEAGRVAGWTLNEGRLYYLMLKE